MHTRIHTHVYARAYEHPWRADSTYGVEATSTTLERHAFSYSSLSLMTAPTKRRKHCHHHALQKACRSQVQLETTGIRRGREAEIDTVREARVVGAGAPATVAQRWRRLRAMTPARLGSTQARQPPDMAPHPYLAWAQRCDDLTHLVLNCSTPNTRTRATNQPTSLPDHQEKLGLAWHSWPPLAHLQTQSGMRSGEPAPHVLSHFAVHLLWLGGCKC